MSDPKNPNVNQRSTPQWGLYQRELFSAPNEDKHPPFNTHPEKLRALAKEKLSEGGWYYASSNTSLLWTHYANWEAFYRTATSIFGQRVPAPIGFAAIGINKIYHLTGELSPARVAGELNLPYCLSTAGSYSIDASASSGSETDSPDGAGVSEAGNEVRFYQLYSSTDDIVTLSLLKRASDNGYIALFLTTDTWQLGWRHDNVANGNYAFYHEHGAGDLGLADAQNAAKMGVDGIVVSNHAGRQVDGAIGSLDALEKIVEAAGDKTYMSHFHRLVMFDSGIRGGADVFKALALGAKFVWIVRLWGYALGSGGEEGVRHIVKGLLADLDILMNVSAYPDFSEINKNTLDSMPRGACFV
ncbi:FMN-dependent dehydrogenase [Xylaria arbuscula]|nr:FMN-dependent dehydrogenase [Xylaria arbuscula]